MQKSLKIFAWSIWMCFYSQSKFAVIFGDEEIKKDHFILKDMQTGVQKAQDIKSITKFLDHK